MSNNLKIVRFCQFCNSTTNNSNKWPEVCRYCKVCYVTIWQQQLTLSYRYSCSPKGRQAENHNHRNQPHTCIEIETHKTRSLCMVNTAINMNRPRLRPTTAMRWLHNAAATLQLIPSFGLQRTSLKFDPCYRQLTPVETRYPPIFFTWPYHRLRKILIKVMCVFFLLADQVLVYNWIEGSCQINLLWPGLSCSEIGLKLTQD